jgi:hypothetical protein
MTDRNRRDFAEQQVKPESQRNAGNNLALETSGITHRMPSGPLYDAAEVALAGIPTVMMFVQSLQGISHNKIEDTLEEHIEQSVVAIDCLARKTMDWILES